MNIGMADNLKAQLKRIEGLCKPIFKLGGEKGVNVKNLETSYKKDGLAKLAFDLFSCLHETKDILEDQNKRIVKATQKINEVESSLIKKGCTNDSLMKNILAEVKEHSRSIADIKANLDEKSERIYLEATKVSSYAEMLKKSAGTDKNETRSTTPNKFAKQVLMEMKASDRRKNLVFFGCGTSDEDLDNENMQKRFPNVYDILDDIGFSHVQPNTIEQIGKSSEDRDPPLRVHFTSEAIATSILKNAWKLKQFKWSNRMYITPDRTLAERNERAQLVKKLKSNIEQHPETKWVIRKGKVVDDGQWTGRTQLVPHINEILERQKIQKSTD